MRSPYASSSLSLLIACSKSASAAAALPSLMDTAAFIAGVDRSDDVIGWAKRHFSQADRDRTGGFSRAMSNRSHSTSGVRQGLHCQHGLFLDVTGGRLCRDLSCPQTRRPGSCWISAERADGPHGHAERYFHDARAWRSCRRDRQAGFHDTRIERPTPETPGTFSSRRADRARRPVFLGLRSGVFSCRLREHVLDDLEL